MRRGEAAALRWDDVDFGLRVIRLPAARTKAGRKLDLPMTDIVNAESVLLDQPDIADLAVEEYRRHREVHLLKRILALHGRPGFEEPITRRAVLRFALTFKDNPAADRFIRQMREKDAETDPYTQIKTAIWPKCLNERLSALIMSQTGASSP